MTDPVERNQRCLIPHSVRTLKKTFALNDWNDFVISAVNENLLDLHRQEFYRRSLRVTFRVLVGAPANQPVDCSRAKTKVPCVAKICNSCKRNHSGKPRIMVHMQPGAFRQPVTSS